MLVTGQTHAIMLLTTWLGGKSGADSPLTPTEWGRFAAHLVQAKLTPADLLTDSGLEESLARWSDKKLTAARIRGLLKRSAALGIALEKWSRAGLWVLTRSDENYPKRWKHRLKNDAPPVLFGCGNQELLRQGGIAIVGSRDISELQVKKTQDLAAEVAHQGMAVISGGARGADEAAMLGALEVGGTALGVLADSLLRAATSSKFREALLRNDLALVSTFNPEVGFNVGNAMARNKYIYCLSDASVVISSTEKKGGTWAGAVENLKAAWVPLWAAREGGQGNAALVDLGAAWLPSTVVVELLCRRGSGDAGHLGSSAEAEAGTSQLEHAVAPSVVSRGHDGQGVRPPAFEDGLEKSTAITEPEPSAPGEALEASGDILSKSEPASVAEPASAKSEPHQESPYQYFVFRLVALLKTGPCTLKEIQSATHHKQKILSEWLRQAIDDGLIRKTRAPVRYALIDDSTSAGDGDGYDEQRVAADPSLTDEHQASFGF